MHYFRIPTLGPPYCIPPFIKNQPTTWLLHTPHKHAPFIEILVLDSIVTKMATPQVVDHSQLEVVEQHLKPSAFQDRYSTQPHPDPQSTYNIDSGSKKTICGLRPTTFFLLLALICVIIAAAVGGGVGGRMAVISACNKR